MRTTIELPDSLFRQVKARAALDGLKLKELIQHYVEHGLSSGSSPAGSPTNQRSELPVARAAAGHPIPSLSNADLQRLLDEEEIEQGRDG